MRTEAIITSLVFDHALRIRLKAEVAEKTIAEEAVGTDAGGSRSNTPDNGGGDVADDETETETAHSRTTTGTSTATTVAPEQQAGAKSGKDGKKRSDASTEDAAKEEKQKGKNLVGKINNLVTSDLDNIVNARDILFVREF